MTNPNGAGTALVTGASSGIGAVYADRLARRGHDLILVARDRQRLEALAARLARETGRRVAVLPADLAEAAERRRVEARLREDQEITLLVNNAGVSAPGGLADGDPDRLEAMMQVNAIAVMRLAGAALPGFIARGRGTIINIASVLALAPELLNGVYSGTKAFVLNLSLALQKEAGARGVRVQAVLPGATRTEIWERSGHDLAGMPQEMLMAVEEMVDAALAGLDQGEAVTIPSLPDAGQWQAFEAARLAMLPNLSRDRAAERYRPAR